MISSGSAIVESDALTANRALATNASGLPVASSVTDTELGYLSGVTSAIQTQINGKQSTNAELTGVAGLSATGIVQRTGAGTYTALGTTAPLSVTSGNVQISLANTSTDGYLSSTDWNTFNNKASTSSPTLSTATLSAPTMTGLSTMTISGAGTQTLAKMQNSVAAANDSGAGILFSANRTTGGMTDVAGVSGIITDISNGAYKGALVFSTANNAAPTERMRIDSSGNIGIGTTAPAYALDLQSGDFRIVPSGSATNVLYIGNSARTFCVMKGRVTGKK